MIRDYLSNNLSNEVTVELHVTNEKPSAAGLRMQTVTVAVGGSITIEPPFGNDPKN